MATSNQELLDELLRHQVDLRRFTDGEVKRVLKLLDRADADLIEQVAAKGARIADLPRGSYSEQRIASLLEDIRSKRLAALTEVRRRTASGLGELAQVESAFEMAAIQETFPAVLDLSAPSDPLLRSLARTRPFRGALLKDWFAGIKASEQRALVQAFQTAMIEGETVDQLIRRVRGTSANGFRDGIIATTRRNAEAVVRTAVNHVSNEARQAVWDENKDIIEEVQWVATLDGRTSAVCRSRDGKRYPVDSGPRPPAHINCRSVTVAVIDGEAAVGNRPQVKDTRRREVRERDFRKEARANLRQRGAKGPLPSSAVTEETRKIRRAWARENVGRVPAKTTYEQWIRRQPAEFQDDVLGSTQGALFRRGGLKLDKFVDRSGRELTIKELRAKHPGAFKKANID